VFWLFTGAAISGWSYTSLRDEYLRKLAVIKQVDYRGKPTVMDVVQHDLTHAELEAMFVGRSELLAPEPGDQLIITRFEGQIESVEFVGGQDRLCLTTPPDRARSD